MNISEYIKTAGDYLLKGDMSYLSRGLTVEERVKANSYAIAKLAAMFFELKEEQNILDSELTNLKETKNETIKTNISNSETNYKPTKR